MKTVTASKARTHLSALLRIVESGERLIVTRRGKPSIEFVAVVAEGTGSSSTNKNASNHFFQSNRKRG
ncbi:MAG: type II toxin-antitoxin system Phd/YefM family antitoxin [Beijerinckiaceae bacterium]